MFTEEHAAESESHWVAMSDLMAGLLMIFMLIAVLFVVVIEHERNKIRNVALIYQRLKLDLHTRLYTEFKDDLPRWGATLSDDASIRFNNTDSLFDRGKSELKTEFQMILANFFPRYLKIITDGDFRGAVEEVRIEGHTDSGWDNAFDQDDAYVKNMALSQARTRTTLAYLLALEHELVQQEKSWLKAHLTANGLSSSKLIYTESHEENSAQSRRVEFRLRTDAEARIAEIIEGIQ
ncbi:OmpA family protein [Zooshikella ganghwensis]|uniref:OmpA family protein n=1 Tax=Zooshikella ganghwensis TaxID=202772 RepID=A0A4P9VQ74_9GAMM|nr:OmpA family protein [Zooshikella ganghwensis]RDH44697.1 OmpA family protein [Zooshikella ganghwensis]